MNPFKLRVLMESGGNCWLCGLPIQKMSHFTVDHVVPLSKGGMNTKGNKRAAHKKCNGIKGDALIKSSVQFLEQFGEKIGMKQKKKP